MTVDNFRNSPVRPTREANIGLPGIPSNNQELKYRSTTTGYEFDMHLLICNSPLTYMYTASRKGKVIRVNSTSFD